LLSSLEKQRRGNKTDLTVHDCLAQRVAQEFLAGLC
jgi:hypothetical protein